MKFDHIRWLTLPPEPVSEALVAYALTRNFYREVEHREAFDRYCSWYHRTATRHRQELRTMQGDINILGWFNRGRNR